MIDGVCADLAKCQLARGTLSQNSLARLVGEQRSREQRVQATEQGAGTARLSSASRRVVVIVVVPVALVVLVRVVPGYIKWGLFTASPGGILRARFDHHAAHLTAATLT